jgi:protein-S-isoprenylcysteine O-methyltransferase Ste14
VPAYRLGFNVVALLLFLPPAWLMLALRGPMLWSWQGPWFWVANALAALALLGFLKSLQDYDGREFLGVSQLRRRERSVLDQESLHLSVLHRHVRHPWYFLGLVLIWTRDMDAARLVSAVLMSLYFAIGSRLEETRLLLYHGEVYRRYRERVPALLPLPWRRLGAAEARALLAGAAARGSRDAGPGPPGPMPH